MNGHVNVHRGRAHGFTLLEVIVAVAILSLGLTVVLSAQTGVFWSYQRATRMSQAPGLLRCKMAELELDLLVKGYPLLDEKDEGDCCEDSELTDYSCQWRIERIELPNLLFDDPMSMDAGAGMQASDELPTGEQGASDEPGSAGPLGALMSIEQSGGAALGSDPTMGGLANMMGGDEASAGMASMVMGLVYPQLKPMLEASIRKVTVTVNWQEGRFDRGFSVTQYLTNPMQGGFNPFEEALVQEASDKLEQLEAAEGDAPAEGNQ